MSESSPLIRALQRAQALVASGDLGGALVLLERAVELGRENLGEDHSDVLAAQVELAGVLLQVDEPVQARRTLEEGYAAGHFRLGDRDPLMLRISHDLGVVAEELGNRHEARKAFGRVAEHGPAALGERHPLVVRARAHLGKDQEQGEVRESAPSPAPPLTPPLPAQRTAPPPQVVAETPPAPVLPPRGDALDVPTTAFPAVVDPGLPADGHFPGSGPWNRSPGRSAPPDGWSAEPGPGQAPPAGNPWTGAPDYGRPQHQLPAQQQQQQQHLAPWAGDELHGRGVPGGVTAWRGEPVPPPVSAHPVLPATSMGGAYQISQMPSAQVAPESGRRRGMAVFAVIAATLSAVVAVAALVFVLADRVGGPDAGETVVPTGEPGGPDVPTPQNAPPGEISLDDQGSAIEVRWSDPADGQVPFMVTMARTGQALRPVSSVGPGETLFRMGGLNRKLDYCFAVVAVYGTDRFATSDQVCTQRR